jgi:hypothetical protein
LKDWPRLLFRRPTTVNYLTGLPRPAVLPATRLPFERRIYTVVASVTLDRTEADLDHHLVLRVGSRTICERALASLPRAEHCRAVPELRPRREPA